MLFFFRVLYQAARLWLKKDSDQYAAALAYFVPFALTPLIFISVGLIGIIYGTEELMELLAAWGAAIDPDVPQLLHSSLASLSDVATQFRLPIIAIAFFSLMIIVALNSITSGMHKLWGVETVGWRPIVYRFARAILFIILIQVYLVFVLILDNMIDVLVAITGLSILDLLNPLLFLISTILLFAVGYGLLPLSAPSFYARLTGAIVAGSLFFGVRTLVSIHFATAPTVTIFGTASLVIVLLVWFYVGAGIILYGAAFAKVFDDNRRQHVLPTN